MDWQVALQIKIYFLLYTHRKSNGFAKIFDFQFLIHLHVLRCSEPNLTIFRKSLSVCMYVTNIFTFFYILYKEKRIGIVKIFDFLFLTDLHFLECSEHDITIFTKSLSVCITNFMVALQQKLMSGNA